MSKESLFTKEREDIILDILDKDFKKKVKINNYIAVVDACINIDNNLNILKQLDKEEKDEKSNIRRERINMFKMRFKRFFGLH